MNCINLAEELSRVFPDLNNKIEIDECVNEIAVYMVGDDLEHIFFMSFELNKDFVRILEYRIARRLRGNGFGSKLYDIFEKHIRQAGFKRIELFLVLISAREFWAKQGFIKEYSTWSKSW